jgi:DNA-binding CsgD family transcriptional regulator/tetratricopeptide (TPR) repeat protein
MRVSGRLAHRGRPRKESQVVIAGMAVVSPVLVGREDELAALVSAVLATPAVVSVEGEAGVGKTRLVAELLARPEVSGRARLAGRCQPIRESFPLGPVIEAVRGLGDSVGGLALGPVAGALRPLLPELAAWLPAAPDPLDDRVGERHRVFRGLVEVLAALGPAVLVLDDLQWADEQTVDFVAYLLAHPPPELAMVIVYRALEASAAVRALTANRLPGIAQAHLEVGPFDQQQAALLGAAILGAGAVSAEFEQFLWDHTGGLPFVIEEVLALLRAQGVVACRDGVWMRRTVDQLEVPRGVRDSTLERVARLPAGASRLAAAMAVVQVPVTLPVLLAVAGEPDAGAGLDEALALGLLVEAGETYQFRHLLAAQAVYEQLSGVQRRGLHARAAAALAQVRPVPFSQVAHHWRRAGRLAEWAVAAEAAADDAEAHGNDAGVVRLLSAVLADAPLDSQQRGRIAANLGRAAIQTLDTRAAVDVLSGALDQNPPAVVRGELRLLLANALNQHGDELKQQRGLWADAVADLGERPDLQVQAMASLGYLIDPDVPVAADIEWVQRSLDLVGNTGDPLLEVFILGKAAAAFLQAGDRRWRELADRVRARTGDAPRQRREVNAYYVIGSSACFEGHLATAEFFLSAGLQAPAAHENRRLEVLLRSAHAVLAYWRGEWQGLDDEVLALLGEQDEHPYGRIDVEIVAGCLDLAHGDVDGALRRLDDLVAMCLRLGAFAELPGAGDALVRALLSRGQADAAVTAAHRCLAPLTAKGLWLPVCRMLPAAAEALAAVGARTEAAQLVGRAEDEMGDLDAPLAPAALHYARGVLAESAHEFRSSAGNYDAVPAPYQAARAREQAGRHSRGASAGAAADLAQAAADYDRLGAVWDYARVASVARRSGVGLPPRHRVGRRGYGPQLSPRERQVAELAARGRTNSEIAAELFVSVSVVEKHLGAARRKLGARSRTELARLITA